MPNTGWRFSNPPFDDALDAWHDRFRPTPHRRDLFLLWCMRVVEFGPPAGIPVVDPEILLVPEQPDVLTYVITEVDVSINYLISEELRKIAIHEIWG